MITFMETVQVIQASMNYSFVHKGRLHEDENNEILSSLTSQVNSKNVV